MTFAEYIPTAHAGDSVRFTYRSGYHSEPREVSAAVLRYLIFPDHVQVRFTPCGYTVDASNFVRLVRRSTR